MRPESWLDPVYDAGGMRAADRWAIEERGVPSLELMEAAGGELAAATSELARPGPIRVVIGKGNNGGDGLVAARRLAELGHQVEVLAIWPLAEASEDARANLDRLAEPPREVGGEQLAAALHGSGAVVDAIFGTGFSGAPRDPARAAIEAINDCRAPVVACDVASGVDASSGAIAGVAVDAELTVALHAAKVGHWVAPGKWSRGELRVVAIGIPGGAPGEPAAGLIEPAVLELVPRRAPQSTKFSSGDVLVVGGSRGLTGAVCLASQAAIRAGAGYATVAAPAALEPILEVKLTEVMTIACPDSDGGLSAAAADPVLERAERASCVVLGPGAGRGEGAIELVRELARRIAAPLLIDADGLYAIRGEPELLAERPAPTVITPHAGELARLLDCSSAEVDSSRLERAREAASASGAVVVLKGDDTLVVAGDRAAINPASTPALATAGTGEVLSGTIGALLARGTDAFAAACGGVLAHSRAGRHAAAQHGTEAVIASDVIAALPVGLARP